VLLGVTHHAIDVFLGQRTATGDSHRLLFARRGVLCGHVHDSVGIDIEGDLDLRNTPGSRRQTGQFKGAELLVVRSHLALTLIDLNQHRRLVVFRCREDLAALGRDGGVALDQLGHHATLGLNTKRQRRHVQQQHILDVSA